MATALTDTKSSEPHLDKTRHVKYWTRCLKTLLPHQYTSNDSNRMYLAFFIICALDLLDALKTAASEEERGDYVNWIYRCQHSNGGFRMWPGTDFGHLADEKNARWDPANVPATYFALASLLALGDDLSRVRRRQTLQWLQKMQRPDGSFGETFVDSKIEGGNDPRFGYCATGVRYILRGTRHGPLIIDGHEVPDFNFDGFVRCVRAAESYDGGIADVPFHEPHAGYTFCSLGALAFVGRLNLDPTGASNTLQGPANPYNVLAWLVSRQTELIDPDGVLDSEFRSSAQEAPLVEAAKDAKGTIGQDVPIHQSPDKSVASFVDLDLDCAGMNGRPNKVADTCYAFWVTGSLQIMQQPMLFDQQGLQKYLLEKTQHPILGGFGKFPGDLPDLYHSYLGLAALSLAGSRDVKELDGLMCISKDARSTLSKLWEGWCVPHPQV